MAPEDAPRPPKPFAESLCWQCEAHRAIEGARSTFLMCTALPVKYPPQPVRACEAFRRG
jgi:hypothetical protein